MEHKLLQEGPDSEPILGEHLRLEHEGLEQLLVLRQVAVEVPANSPPSSEPARVSGAAQVLPQLGPWQPVVEAWVELYVLPHDKMEEAQTHPLAVTRCAVACPSGFPLSPSS